MAKHKPIPIDLETQSISEHPRPGSPPPAGLAIQMPGDSEVYLSWGHPEQNGAFRLKKIKGRNVAVLDKSITDPERAAKLMLRDAYRFAGGVLGHNVAKFDLPIIEDHLGLKPPAWDKVDDTLFTLFLRDPHSSSLSLKPAAEQYLGEPPEERDEVFEWLAEHGITTKRTEKGKIKYGSKENPAGAHIAKAPGALVAAYAIGDISRTRKLHEMMQPWIKQYGMLEAYDRERELAPVLLDNERRGIRVDMKRLERDLPKFRAALKKAEEWIRRRLKAPGLNIDADEDVAKALKKAGIVKKFPQTPTGRDSVSKKNLTLGFFSDPRMYHALQYRNTMATVLTQSLEKWYEEGSKKDGYIFREWNQVRQTHGQDSRGGGARSGRVTVSGLANIAKKFGGKDPDYQHPAFMDVPEPPLARDYILPDPGEEYGHSDFDQQEMKITGHYEDGKLAQAYRDDPKTDIHVKVHGWIEEASGKDYPRDTVKMADFLISYGGGAKGLAERLRVEEHEAKTIISHWRLALPDVVDLDKALKAKFKAGEYIRTLGGRVYFCKPPIIAKKGPRKGQMITFEYTALNYLIQPSAADQTKQALINYYNHPKRKGRILNTVYDEINISMKTRAELKILQECMVNAFKLDVPVTTTLKAGSSWGSLKKLDEKLKEAA
jgi:DNA polymerase I-like protein with 3'-5' exonuclease and polymerase domains